MASSKSSQQGSAYRVVVGVDYASTGEQAIREALAIAASRPGTALHLAHVITEDAQGNGTRSIAHRTELLETEPKRLAQYADAQLRAYGSDPAHEVFLHTLLGRPAEALAQLAVDVDAELIVVGTRGLKGLKRLALGSVAQQLLEGAHCPVLIARPKDYRGLAPSDAVDPLCPECVTTRAQSAGATLWCEYHARPHVRTHVWRSSEVFPSGGHNPDIIPNV